MFQKLIEIFRTAVKEEIEDNKEVLNDELTLTMMIIFNGLGNVMVQNFNVIEILKERISVYGNGEGLEKKLVGNFINDGEEDFSDTYDEPQDEYHDSDDPENYRDEWDIDDDEPTPED